MSDVLFTGYAPQSQDSDERYTPAWIFNGLGLTFDLDPASPGHGAGDCVPAARKVTKAENGLSIDWYGMVWLNPPFSDATAWADKFRDHGNGVFLGPIANARWTSDMLRDADLIWFCRDFAFTHPTHAGRHSSMPLFVAAMGKEAATALRRLARVSIRPGVLLVRP